MSEHPLDDRPSPDRAEISEEKIAGLLRLTGRRPDVPADRTLRVKEEIRVRWRAEVGRRARRRALFSAAVLSAAAALVVLVLWGRRWLPLGSPDPVSVARVEAVSGSATAETPGTRQAPAGLRPADEVIPGSTLRTGPDGRVALRRSSGGSLRLDLDTHVEVVSESALVLLSGAVYVDSGRPDSGRAADRRQGAATRPLEVRTPAGPVTEQGTQFEVRLIDAAVRVRVREGQVSLGRPTGDLEVTSGRELRIDDGGSTTHRDVPVHGEEWGWIAQITPMMEIEGRSLREFLSWISRERGLGLRFDGRDLETSASTIRLKGSIDGMTLDQALESVLPTCGMRHRIEGGLLVLEPLDSPPGRS
jgi:ferric-dicitrate binding protein FerR (iron transport regulator)